MSGFTSLEAPVSSDLQCLDLFQHLAPGLCGLPARVNKVLRGIGLVGGRFFSVLRGQSTGERLVMVELPEQPVLVRRQESGNPGDLGHGAWRRGRSGMRLDRGWRYSFNGLLVCATSGTEVPHSGMGPLEFRHNRVIAWSGSWSSGQDYLGHAPPVSHVPFSHGVVLVVVAAAAGRTSSPLSRERASSVSEKVVLEVRARWALPHISFIILPSRRRRPMILPFPYSVCVPAVPGTVVPRNLLFFSEHAQTFFLLPRSSSSFTLFPASKVDGCRGLL